MVYENLSILLSIESVENCKNKNKKKQNETEKERTIASQNYVMNNKQYVLR